MELDKATQQLIERYALYGDDPNVAALRKELFVTVKMVYGEKINKEKELAEIARLDEIKAQQLIMTDNERTELLLHLHEMRQGIK